MRTIVVTLSTLLLLSACAQARRAGPRKSTLYDPSKKALSHFHRQLTRTANGKSQTRILQFGASHTEADLFTGYLRQYFQHQFGDAGHGFIMPARPWRGYRHMDVRVDSSSGWITDKAYRKDSKRDGLYGLAGFSVRTDSADEWGMIGTAENSAFGKRVDRFEVFYLQQPGGGRFDIEVDGNHYATVKTHARTTSLGVRVVRVQDGPHELKLRPKGDGEVRLLGTVMERRAPGVIVDSLGIRGSRASVMLKWDDALWTAAVKRRRPDLIALAYGTNESGDARQPIEKYEQRLKRVMQKVKAAAPRASCVLFGPTDRPKKKRGRLVKRPRQREVIRVQKKIARQFGCAFFDAVAAMGGPMSIRRWHQADPPLAQKDFVHLTSKGYAALADTFANALMRRYRGPR